MTGLNVEGVVRQFAAVGSAATLDALGNQGWLEGLHPLWPVDAFAGPVVTVGGDPGDNLPLHRGIAEAPSGTIIVAAMGGETAAAVFGDVLARIARHRMLRGVVVDGAVRDVDAIRKLQLPVLCRGRSLRSPTKRCWGVVGAPVVVGSVTVSTGDWLVADGDGAVVVPSNRLEEALAKAEAVTEREADVVRRAIRGESTVDQLGLTYLGAASRADGPHGDGHGR